MTGARDVMAGLSVIAIGWGFAYLGVMLALETFARRLATPRARPIVAVATLAGILALLALAAARG